MYGKAIPIALGIMLMGGWSAQVQAVDVSGMVSAGDGSPLYGVTVTASSESHNLAMSVFTDRSGRYTVPDLPLDSYVLRARKTGYSSARREDVTVTPGGKTIDFTLEPAASIADQLSGADFVANLPNDRMGKAVRQGCVVCHQLGTKGTRTFREGTNAFGPGIGQGRIDTEEEWLKVIEKMRGFDVYQVIPQFDDEALAAWMVDNGFGKPHHIPGKSHLPALSEAASKVVITEYEMGAEFTWLHDMTVGPDGTVWAGDYTRDLLYKLEPRTGEVTSYPYPVKGSGAHTLNPDKDGNIWTTLQLADMVARFNPSDEEWSVYGGLSSGSLVHTFAVDEYNNVFFDESGGLWVTEFGRRHLASVNPGNRQVNEVALPKADIPGYAYVPSPYGIAYNKGDGHVWYSQIGANVIGKIDPGSGEVTQYTMPEEWMGPRRLKAAPDGRIWIPFFSTAEIAVFDPETERLQRYDLPHPGDTPYALVVDGATGIVWVCGTSSNTIYRFDPATEEFTTIPLPSRAAYSRLVVVDYSTGDIYTSYSNFPNAHGESTGGVVARIQLPDEL